MSTHKSQSSASLSLPSGHSFLSSGNLCLVLPRCLGAWHSPPSPSPLHAEGTCWLLPFCLSGRIPSLCPHLTPPHPPPLQFLHHSSAPVLPLQVGVLLGAPSVTAHSSQAGEGMWGGGAAAIPKQGTSFLFLVCKDFSS